MAWVRRHPEQGRLTATSDDGACEVEVKATAADGGGGDGKLVGLGSAVDLSALAGKAVRLELSPSGCPTASLSHVALVVPARRPPSPAASSTQVTWCCS